MQEVAILTDQESYSKMFKRQT